MAAPNQNDVLVLTVSGTGAMEAGIINFLSPGDRVLVGCNGKFGDRWADMSAAFGLQVETITADWGKPLDAEQFREKLAADTEKKSKLSSSPTLRLLLVSSTTWKPLIVTSKSMAKH
jgi:aspartate aminotransferase-like enzyme